MKRSAGLPGCPYGQIGWEGRLSASYHSPFPLASKVSFCLFRSRRWDTRFCRLCMLCRWSLLYRPLKLSSFGHSNITQSLTLPRSQRTLFPPEPPPLFLHPLKLLLMVTASLPLTRSPHRWIQILTFIHHPPPPPHTHAPKLSCVGGGECQPYVAGMMHFVLLGNVKMELEV
jgi:hypothetical protein